MPAVLAPDKATGKIDDDPVKGKISHVVMYKYKERQTNESGSFDLMQSVLPDLVTGGAATGGMGFPGSKGMIPGGTPPPGAGGTPPPGSPGSSDSTTSTPAANPGRQLDAAWLDRQRQWRRRCLAAVYLARKAACRAGRAV